jgi:pilus assembly protein CpaB
MSPVRIGVLVSVALVFAIGLALLARGMASGHNKPVAPPVAAAPPKPTLRVLVAARDLNPGDRLALADFAWQPWPEDNVNKAFIVDVTAPKPQAVPGGADTTVKIETAAINVAKDRAHDFMVANDGGPAARFVDSVVRDPMLKGEPILEAKVVHAGASGILAVQLTPGMRAMSIPLNPESAAGGFILPGDHVDVMQSRQLDTPGGGKRFASGTVLKNVKVLAIDQNTGRVQKSAAVVGATATLELTPEQAELIALTKTEGQLTLILRSYADYAGNAVIGRGAHAEDGPPVPTVVRVFRGVGPGASAQDMAVPR